MYARIDMPVEKWTQIENMSISYKQIQIKGDWMDTFIIM